MTFGQLKSYAIFTVTTEEEWWKAQTNIFDDGTAYSVRGEKKKKFKPEQKVKYVRQLFK